MAGGGARCVESPAGPRDLGLAGHVVALPASPSHTPGGDVRETLACRRPTSAAAISAPGLARKGRHKVTLQIALNEESVSFRSCLPTAA